MATKKVRTENQRSIDRLYAFAQWLKQNGYVKTFVQFESACGLAKNYLTNTLQSPKGSVGADIIRSAYLSFPFLNITWVVTGEGEMINVPHQQHAEISDLINRKEHLENEIRERELILLRYNSIFSIMEEISKQASCIEENCKFASGLIKEVKIDLKRTQNDTKEKKSKDK